MKKLLSLLLAALMIFALVGCSNNNATPEGGEQGGEKAGEDVAVLWYTYSDVYLSSVRAAMNEAMNAAGLNYKDYDANGSQADQTNQIDTALAAGAKVLVVNQVDSGSDDVTKTILEKAEAAGAKVVFFNRGVSENILTAAGATFVGTDYEQAGHMEGKMVGEYVLANYDTVDLNGDGVISYVMFKGDEANPEAICRTQYGQEDADAVLTAAGKPALAYYDAAATTKYLLDANGTWSAAAANEHMETVLSQFNAENDNMIELVIANNDDMALGAIESLKNHGYNKEGETVIPVFGVDATEAAQAAIKEGSMTGTVKQDAVGMADAVTTIAKNLASGAEPFAGINSAYELVGSWRVNIPYSAYNG